jgi:hypothetical protein
MTIELVIIGIKFISSNMKNYHMDTSRDAVMHVGLQMITQREPSSKHLRRCYNTYIAVNAENMAAHIM